MCRALLLVSLFIAATAQAQATPPAQEQVAVVQRRLHELRHELNLGVGYLPADAFYKGITANLGYTYHFNNNFAWQIGRAAYSFNLKSGLSAQLEAEGLEPANWPAVEFMVGSDLMWSPWYGKTAFLNRSVTHFQLALVAGFTIIKFGGADLTLFGFSPGVNVGLSAHIFTGRGFSLRADVGNHLTFQAGLKYIMALQLAGAFNFGRAN